MPIFYLSAVRMTRLSILYQSLIQLHPIRYVDNTCSRCYKHNIVKRIGIYNIICGSRSKWSKWCLSQVKPESKGETLVGDIGRVDLSSNEKPECWLLVSTLLLFTASTTGLIKIIIGDEKTIITIITVVWR